MDRSHDDDRTLFVGNVDNRVTEEILWELFLQAGPLESVKIPKDFKTGQQRNFAFVRFKHEISVQYVIDLMDGIQIFKSPLRLSLKNRNGKDSIENGSEYTSKRRKMNGDDEGEAHPRYPSPRGGHREMIYPMGYINHPNIFHMPQGAHFMPPFPMGHMPNHHVPPNRYDFMPQDMPEEDMRYRRPEFNSSNGEERFHRDRTDIPKEMRRSYSSPHRMHEEDQRSNRKREYHPYPKHAHHRR